MINKKSNKNNKNKKNGFTLIELLVVVLIIGILAAIALPKYQVAVLKAKYTSMMNLTRAIKDAEDRYYLTSDGYTTNFDNLDISYEWTAMSGDEMHPNRNGFFKGGYCAIGRWPDSAVLCMLTSVTPHMMYVLRYSTSKGFSTFGTCVTIEPRGELDDIPNRVCQSLTGNSTPYYVGEDRYYYSFNK